MVIGSLENTCLHVFKEAAKGHFLSALTNKENARESCVVYLKFTCILDFYS